MLPQPLSNNGFDTHAHNGSRALCEEGSWEIRTKKQREINIRVQTSEDII